MAALRRHATQGKQGCDSAPPPVTCSCCSSTGRTGWETCPTWHLPTLTSSCSPNLGTRPCTWPALRRCKRAAACSLAPGSLLRPCCDAGALQLGNCVCSRAALQEQEGDLTVVATGPLTNIALAAKVDERFPQTGALCCCLASLRLREAHC